MRTGISRRRLIQAGSAALVTQQLGCATAPDAVLSRTLPRPNGFVPGYQGLATLPYFEPTDDGRVRLTDEIRQSVSPGVDFHAHLGMSLMLAAPLDYHSHSSRPQYLIDCDHPKPPCELHFDDYLNKIADEARLADMKERILSYGLPGRSDSANTQAIPSLVAEMDAMGVQHAVLLAVVPNLPFRNNPTLQWMEALDQSEHKDRFVVFAGVYPKAATAVEQLREFVRLGARGVKLHPTMQQFYPDDRRYWPIYKFCQQARIPVFFHAGRAGIEPRKTRKYAVMDRYIGAVEAFPDVQFVFGHGGARDWESAWPIAASHDNVWLEIEGQGTRELKIILDGMGHERLLFGSDWPFYPLSATVARVLLATEDNPEARRAIFGENAYRLLSMGPPGGSSPSH